MTDKATIEFLNYRIANLDIMKKITLEIADIVETDLEAAMEFCVNMKEQFIESDQTNRQLMIDAFGEMVDNLITQSQSKVNDLATQFISDMVSSSSDWVNSIDITAEQFEQSLHVIEQSITKQGYNAIDENIPYFRGEIEKGLINVIVDPNPNTFIEDVFESLIHSGVIDYEA